jgi:hypothetical protein
LRELRGFWRESLLDLKLWNVIMLFCYDYHFIPTPNPRVNHN